MSKADKKASLDFESNNLYVNIDNVNVNMKFKMYMKVSGIILWFKWKFENQILTAYKITKFKNVIDIT